MEQFYLRRLLIFTCAIIAAIYSHSNCNAQSDHFLIQGRAYPVEESLKINRKWDGANFVFMMNNKHMIQGISTKSGDAIETIFYFSFLEKERCALIVNYPPSKPKLKSIFDFESASFNKHLIYQGGEGLSFKESAEMVGPGIFSFSTLFLCKDTQFHFDDYPLGVQAKGVEGKISQARFGGTATLNYTKLGKVSSIEYLSSNLDRQLCVYDQPIAYNTTRFGASLSVFYKSTNGEMQNEKFRLEVDNVTRSTNEVNSAVQVLISKIPFGSYISSNQRQPIAKEWNGRQFVVQKNSLAIDTSTKQEMKRGISGAYYWWTIAALIAVGAGLLYYFIRGRRVLLICCCPLLLANPAIGQNSEGPYCGLYCVNAASSALNRRSNFDNLLKSDFGSGRLVC